MSSPPHIELVYFDAGGGHRSALEALESVIKTHHPAWHLTTVHLQNLLSDVDPLWRISKQRAADKPLNSEAFYNGYMRSGLTYGSKAMLRGLQYGISLLGPLIEEKLRQHWRQTRPDLVVSLVPNFNGALFRSLNAIHSKVPFVTIMTDFVDFPPNFWQEKQSQYLICGTAEASAQAEHLGYRLGERLFLTTGMILHPRFYRPRAAGGSLTRRSLGLDEQLTTVLLSFGGYPPQRHIDQVLTSLHASKRKMQAIVMCGGNEGMRKKLAGADACYAAPHTRDMPASHDMPAFMDLADIVVGKPGPGTITECVKRGRPIIVDRSRRTMVQELPNTYWIERNKVGGVINSFKETGAFIEQMMIESRIADWQRNCQAIQNRAVYEIPTIFDNIMQSHKRRAD